MRKHICNPCGNEVDLDNPTTYKHLPSYIKELRPLILAEIGYYYCYVNFWRKKTFSSKHKSISDQKQRVENLIKDFTENEKDNRDNIIWYQETLFLFRDELENMC